MAAIEKRFETKYTAYEMKEFISTKVLTNPALSTLLNNAEWQAYTLLISSKLGKGRIVLQDNIIDVYIDLNMFGSMAKKVLESSIDNEFKQLSK